MASGVIQYFTLDFNCGFARTAVQELTPRDRWRDESHIPKRKSELSNYSVIVSIMVYMRLILKANLISDFDHDCDEIFQSLGGIQVRIENYEEIFATRRWKDQPQKKKQAYTKRLLQKVW